MFSRLADFSLRHRRPVLVAAGLLVPAVMKVAGEANWWCPSWFTNERRLTLEERYPAFSLGHGDDRRAPPAPAAQ